MSDIPEFGRIATPEFISFIFGQKLGRGCSREVYELSTDETKVIKFEYANGKFDNADEWKIWAEVCDKPIRKWFAPCHSISMCGTFLIMDRTAPLREFPKGFRVPAFMADLKPENFGMLRGRIVAHDYGNHRFFSMGLSRNKLVPIK